jgi:hypothetical protein
MPNALITATRDLERLGLVTFENVDYGNQLTSIGRDIADAGLASIWPEIAKIHLSAREASFLSKLFEASAVVEERWADLVFADADEVVGLGGLATGDLADPIRRRTFFGDLERKKVLEPGPRFGGGPVAERPTYVAAVLLTESLKAVPSSAGSKEETVPVAEQERKPGTARTKGRPKGSRYIADGQAVLDAYRRAKQRQDRNPSATPSLEIVAKQLDVSRRTLSAFLKSQEIPWPPE